MDKPTYRWNLDDFQNGCCGMVSVVGMTYTTIRDYKTYQSPTKGKIIQTIKDGLIETEDNIGHNNGSIAVTAVTTLESPKEWVSYFEKNPNWEKMFEFTNTKTGNLCTMWKTEIDFTSADRKDDDDYDFYDDE
jgi:hypothetical protein